MTTQNPESIREHVREAYASFARERSAPVREEPQPRSCCGSTPAQAETETRQDNCGCGSRAATLYGFESVADLPQDVTNLSAGCGDPVTIAGLQPGEMVLDLGSGGGIDCFLSARQVGETGHVIGVDMTDEMIQTANANKAKLGMTNVEFRKGYIEKLPVKDNSIDVVMSNCVINLSPDKATVFKEIVRVLKPGGRVSVSDIVTEGDLSPERRADMSSWAGCIAGAIDVTEYTGLMRAAGLVDVQVVDKEYGDEAPSPNEPRIFSARVTARKPKASSSCCG